MFGHFPTTASRAWEKVKLIFPQSRRDFIFAVLWAILDVIDVVEIHHAVPWSNKLYSDNVYMPDILYLKNKSRNRSTTSWYFRDASNPGFSELRAHFAQVVSSRVNLMFLQIREVLVDTYHFQKKSRKSVRKWWRNGRVSEH